MGAAYRPGSMLGVVSVSATALASEVPGSSEEIEFFAKSLLRLGFVVVAAAGNQGKDVKNYLPASSKYVIGVGSHTPPKDTAPSTPGAVGMSVNSNWGAGVNILANGE